MLRTGRPSSHKPNSKLQANGTTADDFGTEVNEGNEEPATCPSSFPSFASVQILFLNDSQGDRQHVPF
jgi:hypothetical protein